MVGTSWGTHTVIVHQKIRILIMTKYISMVTPKLESSCIGSIRAAVCNYIALLVSKRLQLGKPNNGK